MRAFDYYAPATLADAVAILRDHGEGGRAIAGGTDIVVQMKEAATRFPYPAYLVSLAKVPELRGMEFGESSGLRIGAASTMTDVAEHPVVRERYTALAEGAAVVGSYQTMNMATVGGNVCNAAPSADTSPALLAFGADCVIAGANGQRILPIADLWVGPGKTALAESEVLVELRLPVPAANTGSAYRRHTPRRRMDIAVVGVAAVVTLAGGRISEARIALGAVAPTAVRAVQAEASLAGAEPTASAFARAAEIAAGECSPITDHRASANFRRHLVRVMTERMLAEAVGRAS
jgi:carbon-monoxide dehydrogenase medium subunit